MAESQPKDLSEAQIPHSMINRAALPSVRLPNDSPSPELVEPTPQLDILSTLANELLVLIATFVHTPQPWRSNGFHNQKFQPWDTKDVLNFALCSRHLYNVTESVLYRFFRVPDARNAYDKEAQGAPLQLFLCRILHRPELAMCVRGFHVSTLWNSKDLNMSYMKNDDWSCIHTVIWATGMSPYEKLEWYNEICHGTLDSIILLILCVLPNLEQLEFDRWTYLSEGTYPRLIKLLSITAELQNNSKHIVPPLKALRKIKLLGNASLNQCESFLQLKSVEDFYAECIVKSPTIGTLEEEKLYRSLSVPTKKFCIKNGRISADCLANLLTSLPNLERLCYEYTFGLLTPFKPPRLMSGLNTIKESLQELRFLNHYTQHSGLEDYPIGSLADFTKLKILHITASMLIGTDKITDSRYPHQQSLKDFFPPNLQELYLWHCRDASRLPDQLFGLISSAATYAPKLQCVCLEWSAIKYPDNPNPTFYEYPGFTKAQVIELTQSCSAAGVKIMVDIIDPPLKAARGQVQIFPAFAHPYNGY